MTCTKTFPTLVVVSAATGIVMAEGMKISEIHECSEFLLGHPVWTHEFADPATRAALGVAALSQFPGLPAKQECKADYKAAAARALDEFGPSLMLIKGRHQREAHPFQTLSDIIDRKDEVA
jgi:hypothetical protein